VLLGCGSEVRCCGQEVTLSLSVVLVEAHLGFPQCDRNSKYPTPNNTIMKDKITIVCQRTSICELCEL